MPNARVYWRLFGKIHESGVTVSGLKLWGANWNNLKGGVLEPPLPGAACVNLPVASLVPGFSPHDGPKLPLCVTKYHHKIMDVTCVEDPVHVGCGLNDHHAWVSCS